MIRRLLFILGLTAVSAFAQSPKPQKHALVQVVTAPAHPVSKLKWLASKVLFGVEVPVDGVHVGLYGVDKAFDFVSRDGKVPVLNMVYAGVSVGLKDVAALDTAIEHEEVKLVGKHN